MSYLIIVRGGADTGKTTLVNKLKKELNARVFHLGNTIRKYNLNKYKKHNLHVDKNGKWIPKENYIEAIDILLPKIISLLNNNEKVIIEDNFYHKEVIKYLIKKTSFKTYVFSLKTDINTCMKREGKRKKLTPEKIMQSNKLTNRFKYGYVIDTTKMSPEEVVHKVLSSLPRNN